MLLHDKLKEYNVILASNSPRRRELLLGTDISFTQGPKYETDETYPEEMNPLEVPAYLSQIKSDAYPNKLNSKDILITADTIVIVEGQILGKPVDRSDAIRMLQLLSGEKHTVVSGVTIRNNFTSKSFSSVTSVFFRELLPEEIEFYVDNYKPFDKAGSYGIQEWIGYVGIERIEGSFYNVMGLPVQMLYRELDNFLSAAK